MGLGLRLFAIICLFVTSTSSIAATGKHYYIVVYGYQGPLNLPKDSHSFAAFYTEKDVHKHNDFNYPAPTISWLPATKKIKPLQIQKGFNFSLDETMDHANDKEYVWEKYGPYEIQPKIYERALNRLALLVHPRAFYTMTGGANLNDAPGRAINCIHALGDITGYCPTGPFYGIAASALIVDCLSPFIIH